MDEITKLMVEQLRDAYSAEKQALRAMPRMMKKASAQSVKDALQMHVEQTEGQVERLEKALEMLGGRPGRKVCEGMRGIIEEAQGELEEHDKGPLMDALIIAGQQRVEHYEIASYGTMVAMAKACGQKELANLLAETLAEEKQTDEKLSQLAEREVNPAALESAQQTEPANDKRGGRRSTAA
ncbi:YciE/YciF family protein [Siccirubricoccus deserti]|uniref:Ferritin-like domain-containing protein n=1 Tax=Siccirubricoccus deserti TaxID=2013562 RepID=A0A9X0UCF3_9PROT|nr:ferritin-like domain-containing protein [Siccirubricoccus deserti]MBC4014381.1 ferritin-like domain-containing protein [Siccirubricoccus deserti]GGC33304.1 YciE/YciF family protein [Siccirubricoccus deserti]